MTYPRSHPRPHPPSPAHDAALAKARFPDFPAVPYPSARVLEIAGEATLRAAVRRHHWRLRESAIGHLFAGDAEAFAQVVEVITDFVVEACGGAPRFTETQGPSMMRHRHVLSPIDGATREVWLHHLWLALEEVDFPRAVREEYWDWLERFSIRMVNRHEGDGLPPRHPYVQAGIDFPREGAP